jgi:hypothetical protein
VAYDGTGASHAFIQLFQAGEAPRYFEFPIEAFAVDKTRTFEVAVGPNVFDDRGLLLDLHDERGPVRGWIRFGPWSPWPVTLTSPGIMGPYRFVPGMQTYHGVLSMDHTLTGFLDIGGVRLDFGGGHGYVEKDWGSGFPSSWIWLQSNEFSRADGSRMDATSLTLSIGHVPFATGAFSGFIAGLMVDGELTRFTTYTGAHLECVRSGGGLAYVVMADRRHRLEVMAESEMPATLAAPVLGSMSARDEEALDGRVHVILSEKKRGGWRPVFAATGTQAGVETMDPTGQLATRTCGEGRA